MERETGIEPATPCLEGLGSGISPCPDMETVISARLSPLLPRLIVPHRRSDLWAAPRVREGNSVLAGIREAQIARLH